jgi:hypothetical protein
MFNVMNKTRIEGILKEQGRSKRWLQEQMGMTRTTFYFFLLGKRQRMVDQVKLCAEVLDVKMEDIV